MAKDKFAMSKTLYDVEHGGDIERIRSAIIKAGGFDVSTNHNYDAEQLDVDFCVYDRAEFYANISKSGWWGDNDEDEDDDD